MLRLGIHGALNSANHGPLGRKCDAGEYCRQSSKLKTKSAETAASEIQRAAASFQRAATQARRPAASNMTISRTRIIGTRPKPRTGRFLPPPPPRTSARGRSEWNGGSPKERG